MQFQLIKNESKLIFIYLHYTLGLVSFLKKR